MGSGEQKPYLVVTRVERLYNPEYGDERVCVCGHEYYRHFDTHEDMSNVGCKYCGCTSFEERGPRIDSFSGWFRWLSNFSPVEITVDGITYPSVENAYQAAKFDDRVVKTMIATMKPGAAKGYGRKANLPADWDARKVSVMEGLLREKFQKSEYYMELLENTGDTELIEGNGWGDVFWGAVEGRGENHLGRLIMKIRDDNRNPKKM